MTMLVTKRPPSVGHDRALRRRAARPVAQAIARDHHLPDDLAGVRLRTRRCVPVWQNEQVSVQPTWLDTHSVARPESGM